MTRRSRTEPRPPGPTPVDSGIAELLGDADRPGSWTLLVDGTPQSHVDLDDPTHLEFEYVRRMAAASTWPPPGAGRCGCCTSAAAR